MRFIRLDKYTTVDIDEVLWYQQQFYTDNECVIHFKNGSCAGVSMTKEELDRIFIASATNIFTPNPGSAGAAPQEPQDGTGNPPPDPGYSVSSSVTFPDHPVFPTKDLVFDDSELLPPRTANNAPLFRDRGGIRDATE